MVDPGEVATIEATSSTCTSKNTPRQWKDWYNDLCKFHQIHGHCDVPPIVGNDVRTGNKALLLIRLLPSTTIQVNNCSLHLFSILFQEASHTQRLLCRWVIYQRQLRHCRSMPQDRVELLSKLDFDKTFEKYGHEAKLEDKWNLLYIKLLEFQNKYNQSRVPTKYEADKKLGM